MISGQQKYDNYREQFKRLNKALAAGFNLEAVFIEYAIMEDRTESILVHADKWDAYIKSRKGREPNISTKTKYIQKLAENEKDLLHRYFSDDLLDKLLTWKDQRNRIIHALLKQQLEHNEVGNLANEGNEIVKMLRNRSGSYNRAIDKKRKEAEKQP